MLAVVITRTKNVITTSIDGARAADGTSLLEASKIMLHPMIENAGTRKPSLRFMSSAANVAMVTTA